MIEGEYREFRLDIYIYIYIHISYASSEGPNRKCWVYQNPLITLDPQP